MPVFDLVTIPAFTPCVVIPVYNHAATISAVVDDMRARQLPVFLIDDGSDVQCAEQLQRLAAADGQVHCQRLAPNRGKGAAVLAGFRAASAAGFTHGLQIDADGQHDAQAVAGALDLARRHPDALIAGDPIFDASIPTSRRYGRWATHIFVWLNTWSFAIRDALCGFRVYPLAPTLALAGRKRLGARMDFDIDIAVRLLWDGLPVVSVPVAVHYPADGVSHFDLLRDNRRIAATHIRLLLGMLGRAPFWLWRWFVNR